MRTFKAALRGVLAIAVMLSALMLAAPSADAVESGAVCAEGTLNADNVCEIEGLPGDGDSCPEGAIELDGECFQQVPATELCDAGEFVDGECRIPAPDGPPELSCEEGELVFPFLERDIEDDDGFVGIINGPGDGPGPQCVVTEPAQEVPVCEVGAVVEGDCVEFYGPAIQEETCLNEQDEGGQCYRIEPAEAVCLDPTFPYDDECAFASDPILIEFVCPNPEFTDVVEFDDGDHCGITEFAEPDCEIGEYVGFETCLDFVELPFCEDIYAEFFFDLIFEDNGTCYGVNEVGGNPPCVQPLVPVFGGDFCGEPLGPAPECPDGYDFDEEGCIGEFEAFFICSEDFPLFLGFDEGGQAFCFQDFGPFVPIFDCDQGQIFDDGVCFTVVPTTLQCLEGIPIIDTDDCRVDEDPVLGDPFCPEGEITQNGDGLNCTENFGPARIEFLCPGDALLDRDRCLTFIEPTLTPTCGDALGEPGNCYQLGFVTFDCGDLAQSLFDPALCLEPVDRVGEGCEEGFEPADNGRCLRFVEAHWFCAGRVVTINMVLGDSGIGTNGNDVILGTDGADYIYGRSGRDYICGQAGDDLILGGFDRDVIYGQAGADQIYSGPGNDFVSGGANGDYIYGAGGNDDLRGNAGNDAVDGGMGDDRLNGGGGSDNLHGGNGSDFLDGSSGFDVCRGGSDPDTFANCESSGVILVV